MIYRNGLVFLTLALGCQRLPPIDQLRQEMEGIKPPQGATVIEHLERHDSPSRTIALTYRTMLPAASIGDYYKMSLAKRGWRPCRERAVSNWGKNSGEREWFFGKDRMEFVVDYVPGDRERSSKFTVEVTSSIFKMCGEKGRGK
jgi:hypothetical protein